MAEYIDREALYERITALPSVGCAALYRGDVETAIEQAPAADVAKVRYGYWKDNTNGTFTCTACGCRASKMKYCGHCGAKMLGVAMTKSRYDELERHGRIVSDCLYFITNEEDEKMNFFKKKGDAQEALEFAKHLKEKTELCRSFLDERCVICERSNICTLESEINKYISHLAFGNDLSVGDLLAASRKIKIIVDCEYFDAKYPVVAGYNSKATFHSNLPCNTCDARPVCKIAVLKSSVDKQVSAICNMDDGLNARVLCWTYRKREDGAGK